MSLENLTDEEREVFQLGYLIALKHNHQGIVNPDTLAKAIDLEEPCPLGYYKDENGNCVPYPPDEKIEV